MRSKRLFRITTIRAKRIAAYTLRIHSAPSDGFLSIVFSSYIHLLAHTFSTICCHIVAYFFHQLKVLWQECSHNFLIFPICVWKTTNTRTYHHRRKGRVRKQLRCKSDRSTHPQHSRNFIMIEILHQLWIMYWDSYSITNAFDRA